MDYMDILTYVILIYTGYLFLSTLIFVLWYRRKDFTTKELPRTEQDLVRMSHRISQRLSFDVSSNGSRRLPHSWIDPTDYNGSSRNSNRISTRSISLLQTNLASIPIAESVSDVRPTLSTTSRPRTDSRSSQRRSVRSTQRESIGRQSAQDQRARLRQSLRARTEGKESDRTSLSSNQRSSVSRSERARSKRLVSDASLNLSANLEDALKQRNLGQVAQHLTSNGLQTVSDLKILSRELIDAFCVGCTPLEKQELELFAQEVQLVMELNE